VSDNPFFPFKIQKLPPLSGHDGMKEPGKPWESKRDIRRAASCGLAFGNPASREPQSPFDSQGLLISFFESCPLKGGNL